MPYRKGEFTDCRRVVEAGGVVCLGKYAVCAKGGPTASEALELFSQFDFVVRHVVLQSRWLCSAVTSGFCLLPPGNR